MTERRLDELVAQLASTRPMLDDLTRARVASRIEAARTAAPVVARRRWPLVAAGGAVVAAAAIALLLRGGRTPAPSAPATELTAGAGTPVRGELAGAAITLYGPGRAREEAGRIVVDEAETVIVDRAAADAPLDLVVGKVTIRALAATFAVDARVMRVTAIRGDLLVRCDGDDVARAVVAGESTTCDARIASREPAPTKVSPAARPEPQVARADAPGDQVARADQVAHAAPARAGASVDQVARPVAPAPAAQIAAPATAAIAQPTAPLAATGTRSEPSVAQTEPPVVPNAEPAAKTVTEVAPQPTPDERYVAAERLIAADPRAARAALRDLVAAAPQAAVAAPALVDLARLAIAAGDTAEARTALDRLAVHPHRAPLAMPADYLRCKIDVAPRCLARFREMYPDSPHDAEVLARLAATTAATDCSAAQPLIAEYLRRYPQRAARPAIEAWRDRCR